MDFKRNRKLRKTLANLRISCHNLAVEQGRQNILLNKRICLICQKKIDQYIECKQFDSLRKKYIPDIVYSSPTYSKFIFFLQNKNTDILKNLALYISEAYVLRDKILKNY